MARTERPIKDVLILLEQAAPEAVRLAAGDLAGYFQAAAGIAVEVGSAGQAGNLDRDLVLVGSPAGHPLLAEVARGSGLPPLRLAPQNFALRSARHPRAAERTCLIAEASDLLGLQYACYDLAERVLGVQYASIYADHVPKVGRVNFPRLNVVEGPDFPHRGVWMWHYGFDQGRLGNWDDLYEWWRERDRDWGMLRRTSDWAIKNKQDFICWLGDLGPRLHEFAPTAHRQYEAMRGLKTIVVVNPGSSAGVLPGDEGNLCTHDPSYRGFDPDHLCPHTARFWQVAEERLAEVTIFGPENLLGVVVYFGESTCSGFGSCLCQRCGRQPNWKKYLEVVRFVERRLREQGIDLPVGISRGASVRLGPNGDREFAQAIVPHLSPGSFCSIRTMTDHTWQEMGAWFEAVEGRNGAEGADLRIWKEAENLYMCGSADIPLPSTFYFESRERDFARLARDPLVALHHFNLVTNHFLEWLKSYYTVKNQWHFEPDWRRFVREECGGLFGRTCGAWFARAFDCLHRVLSLELRPPEYDFPAVDFVILGEHRPEYARFLGIGVAGWGYISNIILDLRLTENVITSEELERHLDRVTEHLAHYLRLVNAGCRYLGQARAHLQDQREFFAAEVFEPMAWSFLFLRYRIEVVQALCDSVRAKQAAAAGDRRQAGVWLTQAARRMRQAVRHLREYRQRMPYTGPDLTGAYGRGHLVDPPAEDLEEMSEGWRKMRAALGRQETALGELAGYRALEFYRFRRMDWTEACSPRARETEPAGAAAQVAQ